MKWRGLFVTICYLYPLITVAQTANTFALTGNLNTARAEHTATLLPSGKVLVAGGADSSSHLASAEIYDSSTKAFSSAGSMNTERSRHSATLLANGQVLIAGGENVTGVLGSAELYDPSTGAFSVTGSLTSSRELHTATLLPDGKVLVVGGFGVGGATNTAELYDPVTGTFTPTGAMSVPRGWHTATLLQNGKVIVTGGFAVVNGGGFTLDSAEIYDPSNGTFSPAGKMTANRQLHTASLLSNGKVLIAGGVELVAGFFSYTASAELYDPLTGLFTSTGGMAISHALHTAIVLQNGQVLIAGGDSGCSAFGCAFVTAIAELYDPSRGLFASTASSMNVPRERHTATLLVDGNVLVAGGANSGFLASAELFQPAAALSTSTISVSTNNAVATFTIAEAGGNTFTGSGTSFTQGVPPGTYTITFGSVTGFLTPASTTARLGVGQTINFNGAYIAALPPIKTDLGAQGKEQNAGEPVSTGTGNYYYQHTDFAVPGRGIPLAFARTYNTLDNYAGPLGANWTHTYNVVLTPASNGTATIKWGDGHSEIFTANGSAYLSQPGVFSVLAKNTDGSFTLTKRDQTRYAFASTGKLLGITDKNGSTMGLAYDGAGNLLQVTDAGGRSLNFSLDSNNRIIQVTDPGGRTELFQYDENNDLVQATDAAGSITTCAYDSNHRVLSITLANGQKLLDNTYDGNGRVVSQANGLGNIWTFAYGTPNPGNTTVTDARGNKSIHIYDSLLRIVQVKDALGGIVSFTYDENNNRTSVANQNGNITTFSYDGQGNVTAIKDPSGNVSAFRYDVRNDLLVATDARNNTTTFGYDGNGNLISIQDALGHTTAFTYDAVGQVISKKDATGNTTGYGYDPFSNLTSLTDALGHSTTVSYDSIGRLTAVTDANRHTALASYDALSRLVALTDALNHRTAFSYDPAGNLLTVTDANGNTTNYSYDAVNNLVAVTDALGHITKYSYDENNNRTAFINAKGNATFYTYDPLNRLSAVTDPLISVTAYTYDALGNVIAIKDANGNTNRFAYDVLNRLSTVSYGDGATVAYSYDANGNRIAMTDTHGTTTYSYDPVNRLTSVANPDSKAIKYQYNAVGNRQSLTYPDGKIVTYAYDPVNRLSKAQDWLGRTTNYLYDPSGNLLSVTYPNQAGMLFTYDNANRLTAVINSFLKAGGKEDGVSHHFGVFEYLLDAVGNRLQVSNGRGKVIRYSYDKLYELTGVVPIPSGDGSDDQDDNGMAGIYAYDAVGNRVSASSSRGAVSYSYDAADRLLQAGIASYTYDANGNQTSVTNTSARSPIVYRYDAANRLISVTGNAVNSSFSYDGDGNRISQSVGQGTFSYVNDVANALTVVLQESGPDGDISYAYGLNLISESSSGFDNFYQYDGLGSVVGVTNLQGRLIQRYIYDAWGQTLRSIPASQVSAPNKFQFTGEALDPGTGLYYLRARYYDPNTARFLSKDPFPGFWGLPLTLNRFVYAVNQPTNGSDPSGLCPDAIWLSGTSANSTLPLAMSMTKPSNFSQDFSFMVSFLAAAGENPEVESVLLASGLIQPELALTFFGVSEAYSLVSAYSDEFHRIIYDVSFKVASQMSQ